MYLRVSLALCLLNVLLQAEFSSRQTREQRAGAFTPSTPNSSSDISALLHLQRYLLFLGLVFADKKALLLGHSPVTGYSHSLPLHPPPPALSLGLSLPPDRWVGEKEQNKHWGRVEGNPPIPYDTAGLLAKPQLGQETTTN